MDENELDTVNPKPQESTQDQSSSQDQPMIDSSWGIDPSWGEGGADDLSPEKSSRSLNPFQKIKNWIERKRFQSSIDEIGDKNTEKLDLTPDSPWKTGIKVVFAFLASAIAAYLVLTAPSQLARAAYFFDNLGKKNEPSKIIRSDVVSGEFKRAIVPSLTFRAPIESPPKQNEQSTADSSIPEPFQNLGDNELIIPKIGVNAPIIWDSSWDEKTMLENLQKGVVHYGGTDFPNREKGNVFITGHSSYYWWDKGKYKTIFALLPNIKVGDQVALTYEGKVFVYEVFETITVKPTQVDVLDSTDKPILSLMTCVPVGTSLNRLIVKSNLVGVFDRTTSAEPEPTIPESETTPAPSEATGEAGSTSPAPLQSSQSDVGTTPFSPSAPSSDLRDTINLLPGR